MFSHSARAGASCVTSVVTIAWPGTCHRHTKRKRGRGRRAAQLRATMHKLEVSSPLHRFQLRISYWSSLAGMTFKVEEGGKSYL